MSHGEGAEVVTAEDVAATVAALSARVDALLAEHERDPSCVDVAAMHRQVATEVATGAGRAGESSHFLRLIGLLVAGRVSTDPELVECRTAGCGEHRGALLTYAGTTCPGCGRPRSRVLGPVSGGECPTWCREHPSEHEDFLTHARTLVDDAEVTMGLEETWSFEETTGKVTRGAPELVVTGDETCRFPATPDTIAALRAALGALMALPNVVELLER